MNIKATAFTVSKTFFYCYQVFGQIIHHFCFEMNCQFIHGLSKSYCLCIQAQPFSLTGIYHYDKNVLARLIYI